MAKKQNKQWSGMISVGRVLLVLVLLILLFPFFADPYSSPLYIGYRGRTASCESNMKQLGLALIQYAQDNDNTLPRAATADGHGWHEAIYPYVKSVGVYRCPDDPRDSSRESPDNLAKSYAANSTMLDAAISSVNSDAIYAVDTRGWNGEDWDITSPAFLPNSGRELYAHLPRHIFYDRPAGTVNCLFTDGHVKSKKPADTLTPTNLWTRNNAPFAGQDLANAQAILRYAEKE